MSSAPSDPACTGAPARPAAPVIELGAADLHGGHSAYCPNPKMALWSGHPRVYIDIGTTGEGRCPYCGTVYRLRAGETLGGH